MYTNINVNDFVIHEIKSLTKIRSSVEYDEVRKEHILKLDNGKISRHTNIRARIKFVLKKPLQSMESSGRLRVSNL